MLKPSPAHSFQRLSDRYVPLNFVIELQPMSKIICILPLFYSPDPFWLTLQLIPYKFQFLP